jgi:hypothetical protein
MSESSSDGEVVARNVWYYFVWKENSAIRGTETMEAFILGRTGRTGIKVETSEAFHVVNKGIGLATKNGDQRTLIPRPYLSCRALHLFVSRSKNNEIHAPRSINESILVLSQCTSLLLKRIRYPSPPIQTSFPHTAPQPKTHHIPPAQRCPPLNSPNPNPLSLSLILSLSYTSASFSCTAYPSSSRSIDSPKVAARCLLHLRLLLFLQDSKSTSLGLFL